MLIPYHWQYLPLLMQIVFALGLATAMVVASKYVGRHRDSAVKLGAYECGIVPVGDARLWHAQAPMPPPKLTSDNFLRHRDSAAQDPPSHFQLQFLELLEISFSPNFHIQ